MSVQHTEGDWHYSPTMAGKPGGPRHYDIGSSTNANVGIVYPAEGGERETLANARLWAAAPRMLRTLEMVRRECLSGFVGIALSSAQREEIFSTIHVAKSGEDGWTVDERISVIAADRS